MIPGTHILMLSTYASGFGYVNNGGDGSGSEPSDITGWGIGAGSTDTAGTKFSTGNGYGNRFEPCNEINEYP